MSDKLSPALHEGEEEPWLPPEMGEVEGSEFIPLERLIGQGRWHCLIAAHFKHLLLQYGGGVPS